MNLNAYIKGCKRGEFTWNCVESGEYGDSASVDVEEVLLDNKQGTIKRLCSNSFEAEVDNLNNEPFYDFKEFTSRLSARKWCEKMIRKDIKLSILK